MYIVAAEQPFDELELLLIPTAIFPARCCDGANRNTQSVSTGLCTPFISSELQTVTLRCC